MRVKSSDTKRKLFKIKLKKGDLVQVLSGKYKGKQGRVLTTHAADNKARRNLGANETHLGQ